MDTVYGRIVTADEVCAAVEQTLTAWFPAMIDALGVGDDIEAPHTYQQVPTIEALADADIPAIGIATPGWSSAPERDEDGDLRLTWRVNIVAFIRGDDYAQTQHNTRTYAAIISTILAQQKTLLGFASGTELNGEAYEPINTGARTLGGALVEIDVTVDAARNDLGAPDGLPPDIFTTDTVTDVGLDVALEV